MDLATQTEVDLPSVETNYTMSNKNPRDGSVATSESSRERHLPSKVIDLTAESDSIQYIGEDTRVTQLRALHKMLRDMQKSSHGSSTVSDGLLLMLPLVIEGSIQYIGELQMRTMQAEERISLLGKENRRLHDTTIILQSSNYEIQGDKDRAVRESLRNKAKWIFMEKAAINEQNENQWLRIELSNLERRLRDEICARRGSTVDSDEDKPRKKRCRSHI